MKEKEISGFSKMSKTEKIQWLATHFLYNNPLDVIKDFANYWHDSVEEQKVFDGFSENTITNFYMPLGVAPNFKINGKIYAVPMVTEESSVVAAAANAAKFWLDRGGFKSKVIQTTKVGQVHFIYNGDFSKLNNYFPTLKKELIEGCKDITANMENRGGGILDIELKDLNEFEPHCRQLLMYFNTVDSMGANFINSVLERCAELLVEKINANDLFTYQEKNIQIIMSILSNYTPECIVRAEVSCKLNELGEVNGLDALQFAEKFARAVRIARIDPYRAATHNKGIMNGVDSVVIATGNDFRAVEACVHAYASRGGSYASLSACEIVNDEFRFWIDLPIALGTVGGLTSLHPMAKKSLEMLGSPKAEELMNIVACVGLAQNFAAVKSLVTTGIQQGHMKMHLSNILMSLQATEEEIARAKEFFKDKVVSFNSAREYLASIRKQAIG